MDALTKVKLVLEDGYSVEGNAFGARAAVAGEVVFNTSMTGYVESITDPSYRGQILTFTYPLVGNYGVPPPREPGALTPPYQSDRIQIQGLVVQEYSADYNHWAAGRSLAQWLESENVPAITGVDTRALTRHLRARGTMMGWMFPSEMSLDDARRDARRVDMKSEVFRLVTPQAPVTYPGGPHRILLADCGVKDGIVRALLKRGASVTRVPWSANLVELASDFDGIVLGNGPGDPADLGPFVDSVRQLLADYLKPIFAVCLGHQILARAAGFNTYRLPYGHRGVNQPVQDLVTRRCYVTSQNHGYAVDDERMPAGWEPWFINLNDGTNEGLRSQSLPYQSVQFHPEGNPGPQDTAFLFDDFMRQVRAATFKPANAAGSSSA